MTRLVRLGRRWADAARWDVLTGIAGVLIFLGALLAVIVFLPPRVVEHPRDLSTADWLKSVQDLRATILQGLGGLALLGTLYFSARTLRLNRRGQLTERFTKAIEQVGSDKLAMRLGGIYALEQIALDSEELHWPVMEVLVAFVHDAPPDDEAPKQRAWLDDDTWLFERDRVPIRVDLQAAVTVLGRRPKARRRWEQQRQRTLNLRFAHLPKARLSHAHLGRLAPGSLADSGAGSADSSWWCSMRTCDSFIPNRRSLHQTQGSPVPSPRPDFEFKTGPCRPTRWQFLPWGSPGRLRERRRDALDRSSGGSASSAEFG